jgi:hypothetical protein
VGYRKYHSLFGDFFVWEPVLFVASTICPSSASYP